MGVGLFYLFLTWAAIYAIMSFEASIVSSYNTEGDMGHVKYHYTVEDVAILTHKTEGAVRQDVHRGRLVMASLRSVAVYIAVNLLEKGE